MLCQYVLICKLMFVHFLPDASAVASSLLIDCLCVYPPVTTGHLASLNMPQP